METTKNKTEIKIGNNTWKETSFNEKTHIITIENQKGETERITPWDVALIEKLKGESK